ncbi:hypothetical protein J8I29_09320 [Labrys sp. LIt4]|uniref:hypothetical protein n=1 Tax=Labrys sp. LIt4 TaxID=2821355 RepID=UPI001ADEFE7D|nr:hypothetical protein [Labrys sp. LIt4]MBP0579505.1 hypothetical protein [Labrys sp. LIt4]
MLKSAACLEEKSHETIPAMPSGMVVAFFPPDAKRIAGPVPATPIGSLAPQGADEPDQAIITPSV